MVEQSLQEIRDRHQMIRFLDGYAVERMEELDERRLKRPLVKTHLLEVPDGDEARASDGLQALFARRGVRLRPLDDELFLVSEPNMGDIGFVERLRPRIVALYSVLKSPEPDAWIERLVHRCPEIDHVWLSGITLNVMWDLVARVSSPNRFTRLTFKHESIFDIDQPKAEFDDETGASGAEDDEIGDVVERRETSFRLKERVGVVRQKLDDLQHIYSPLFAISQLRFPSPVSAGGHDFYDNGKVTNTTDSFRDHRNHVLFVARMYDQLLHSTEEEAWYSVQESLGAPGQFHRIVGAPVVIRFQEALREDVFEHWISATFTRKRNRFRLWGRPIRLGPRKVHVYGVDRHLWQPLFLELTARGCTAIIPNGTCGNTVHRLVTNIQRYLDPGAEAFIGETRYSDMVRQSTEAIPYAVASD